MKILLITTLYPGYQGESRKEASYAIHYFVKNWISMGHDVRVIKIWPKYPAIFNLTKKGGYSSRYSKDGTFNIEGVEVNRLTINKFPRIDYFQKDLHRIGRKILHEINRENRPDIIVCHMINPSIYISIMLKEELNIPLILTIHQTDLFQLTNKKRSLKNYIEVEPLINRIGFRNRQLMDRYNKLNHTSTSCFIVHSGINRNLIISDSKLQNKINSRTKTIFIAANMISLKNIDIVIKAFEKIAANQEVYLKIAGEGPEKNKLVQLAKDSTVNNQIEFLGYISRESVIETMEKSDIFVMVSSPETFGLVYLEAMSKGCITIGTKGEGIDGVIIDNENGYLCEPKDVDGLANKLERALNLNCNEKEKIIKNAVETAKNMTQEEMSKKYLDILQDTINKF